MNSLSTLLGKPAQEDFLPRMESLIDSAFSLAKACTDLSSRTAVPAEVKKEKIAPGTKFELQPRFKLTKKRKKASAKY